MLIRILTRVAGAEILAICLTVTLSKFGGAEGAPPDVGAVEGLAATGSVSEVDGKPQAPTQRS
ncbi:MAG: hypothetical protein ABSF96_11085 [Steroidobacteraceae bacterium]